MWLTGPPAAGKSTIAASLVRALDAYGVDVVVLESDQLRRLYTPRPTYAPDERERFYAKLLHLATWLVGLGAPVVVDATAHRRRWRDAARARIARFVEVWVNTPLEVCAARDPKGLYRAARTGEAPHVPGIGEAYEPPEAPEVVVDGAAHAPEHAARTVVDFLVDRGWVARERKTWTGDTS